MLRLPLDGDTVVMPASPAIADYMYRRKLVTVNGMGFHSSPFPFNCSSPPPPCTLLEC
jgi:hypothetical protein